MKDFIYNNKWALLISIIAYLVFLNFSISGNRICDCKETEKTQSGSSAYRGGGVNRFYHK
jgi:hypothetical protein